MIIKRVNAWTLDIKRKIKRSIATIYSLKDKGCISNCRGYVFITIKLKFVKNPFLNDLILPSPVEKND